MSESTAYIHIEGDRYYQITPRYPFIVVNDYLQKLPVPLFREQHGMDTVDYIILMLFICIAVCGCCLTCQKMKLLELYSALGKRKFYFLTKNSDFIIVNKSRHSDNNGNNGAGE